MLSFDIKNLKLFQNVLKLNGCENFLFFLKFNNY